MEISPKQLKLLSAIAKRPEIRTDKNDLEDVQYLHENGLVVCMQCNKPGDYFFQARISEKGKAFLYAVKHKNRRANIALTISIVAIVLSLLTAFTPFPELAKSWINSLIQHTLQ